MKLSAILAAHVLALLMAAPAALAEDNPAMSDNTIDLPAPGVQAACEVTLPLATGDLRAGGGAMALGGANPIDESKTEKVKFLLFMPVDESAKTEDGYPLMLFLHGAGERGDNLDAVKTHGPPKICEDPERSKTWKFITVSPQVKRGSFWSPTQLRLLIDLICEQCPVDRSRIYVTGLSMGGFGTWGMVAHHSDIVAAAAPICGGYSLEFAPNMVKTPIWAFHGTDDPAVRYEFSKNLVEAVRAEGNEDVKFTTYPNAQHDVWTRTYDNPELYDWFLSKKLEK